MSEYNKKIIYNNNFKIRGTNILNYLCECFNHAENEREKEWNKEIKNSIEFIAYSIDVKLIL